MLIFSKTDFYGKKSVVSKWSPNNVIFLEILIFFGNKGKNVILLDMLIFSEIWTKTIFSGYAVENMRISNFSLYSVLFLEMLTFLDIGTKTVFTQWFKKSFFSNVDIGQRSIFYVQKWVFSKWSQNKVLFLAMLFFSICIFSEISTTEKTSFSSKCGYLRKYEQKTILFKWSAKTSFSSKCWHYLDVGAKNNFFIEFWKVNFLECLYFRSSGQRSIFYGQNDLFFKIISK